MKQSLLMPLNTAGLHKQMLSLKELNHTGTNFEAHGGHLFFDDGINLVSVRPTSFSLARWTPVCS